MSAPIDAPKQNDAAVRAGPLELRMLSGLHRGAALELGDEPLSLGASPYVDVLVADAGIAKLHCRIVVVDNAWMLAPAEGIVFDTSGVALREPVVLRSGSMFRLADVWLGFFHEHEAWIDPDRSARESAGESSAPRVQGADARGPRIGASVTSSASARYPRARASVAFGVLLLSLIPLVGWFVSSATAKSMPTTASVAPERAHAEDRAKPTSPAKLAEEFSHALAERELLDRLEVQLGPREWTLKGSLDADETGRLQRLLVRFDETHRPAVTIRVNLLPASEMLPFKVVEAVGGKTACVVTDSGERLFVGDSLQGYRLASVDQSRAVFVGKRRVEVVL